MGTSHSCLYKQRPDIAVFTNMLLKPAMILTILLVLAFLGQSEAGMCVGKVSDGKNEKCAKKGGVCAKKNPDRRQCQVEENCPRERISAVKMIKRLAILQKISFGAESEMDRS